MSTTRNKTFMTSAALVAGAILLTVSTGRSAAGLQAAADNGRTVWGTWVLALDATPFGIPGGFLPGMFTFHRDGTFIVTDGGDLGSIPFTTTDTPQHGVWERRGRHIVGTSLFLRNDQVTGDIEGWHRVRFRFQFGAGGDRLYGLVEEEVLACDPNGPTPFKLLNCPDPTTGTFTPAPFSVRLKLTRLRVVA